jgi:hypothetical protein
VSFLLSEAYGKAASVFNAANGFRATGLWPVDRSVFSKNDFIPSENLSTPDDICNGDPCCSGAPQAGEDQQKEVQISISSFKNLHHTTNVTTHDSPSVKRRVRINKISPLSKATTYYEQRIKQGAQKAVRLTISPYKDHLKLTKQKQNTKELKQKEQMKKGKSKNRHTPATK